MYMTWFLNAGTFWNVWYNADSSIANFFGTNPNYIVDEKAYENLNKTILGSKSSEDEEQMEIRDKYETMRLVFLIKKNIYIWLLWPVLILKKLVLWKLK